MYIVYICLYKKIYQFIKILKYKIFIKESTLYTENTCWNIFSIFNVTVSNDVDKEIRSGVEQNEVDIDTP